MALVCRHATRLDVNNTWHWFAGTRHGWMCREGVRQSQILTLLPLFQNGAKFGFKMCFGSITLGAGDETRLETRTNKFTPHCIYRPIL